MVLVDTSIWVNHLRKGVVQLERLLLDEEVVCHPFIIGELACGNIKNRSEILDLLQDLPKVPTIDLAEYLYFIEQNHLSGIGIGFVDVHLLASAQLSGVPLWTNDKRLKQTALKLKILVSI
jgi:predicted nucleic acid-binding protein